MGTETRDWLELKAKKPLAWHNRLSLSTRELLKTEKFELSHGNGLGYFHHVRDEKQFQQMQKEWERKKSVPAEWITKGNYPGIWTSLFSPHNTYSYPPAPPIGIIRFYFKEGFFVYDRENRLHKKISGSWRDRGRGNPWRSLKNEKGETMEKRMMQMECPTHKCFYLDNNFGAIIGYSDYTSPVIVLETAVEKIEFLTFYK